MKTAWLVLLASGVAGVLSATACTVTTSDGSGNGGSTNAEGGSTAQGGSAKGGASSGGATSGGGSSGGASTTGGAATTGGTTATGGAAPMAGAGGVPEEAVCDPNSGPASTPAGSCTFSPADLAGAQGECLTCLSKSCCTDLKNCYGTSPLNECGYGGPQPGDTEYLCFQTCLVAKAKANGGSYDDPDEFACIDSCTTPGCATIGDYTNDVVACLHMNCEMECLTKPSM